MTEQAGPTRQERIVMLLENYVDVEASGLRDQRGEGEHLPLMSRCWNHPSYVELDRLLDQLRTQRRHLYWHVSQRYFYSTQRRVLQCPRCLGIMPSWHQSPNFHKHGHKNVAVVPRVVRVSHPDVHVGLVEQGVAWIDGAWALQDVYLPDELLPLVA
jgi:hypothetical protein